MSTGTTIHKFTVGSIGEAGQFACACAACDKTFIGKPGFNAWRVAGTARREFTKASGIEHRLTRVAQPNAGGTSGVIR